MKNNNPAARLYNILREAKDNTEIHSRALNSSLKWILKVDKDDDSLLMKRLGLFMGLPVEIANELKKYDDISHEVYLEWVPQFLTAFKNLQFNQAFSRVIGVIDEKTIYGVRICADQLSRKAPEIELDPKDIEALLKQTDNLFNDILKADLDHEIKTFMLDKLDNIHNALLDYFLTGSKDLTNSMELVAGALIFHPKAKEIFNSKEKDKRVKAFWELMSRIAIILAFADGTEKIGTIMGKLLGP